MQGARGCYYSSVTSRSVSILVNDRLFLKRLPDPAYILQEIILIILIILIIIIIIIIGK